MYRPQPDEFGAFYQRYIDNVPDDVISELEKQASDFEIFLRSIPPEKWDYAYAEGKWTIKELVGHVIDTERIMVYRLTCFARNDKTELPGFEENSYVANAHFAECSAKNLTEEFKFLRTANIFLFKSLTSEELTRKGIANGNPLSVLALLFVIAGHLNHHREIIRNKYLN